MYSIRVTVFFLCPWAAVAATAPTLTYSTYLRDAFSPNAIATDPSGNIYLAGSAVIDPASGAKAAMVIKLNPQANQYLYVSTLNGQPNQVANAIAADAAGNAYVAGSYSNQSGSQSFIARLDTDGGMLFLTTLGAGTPSTAQAVAVDAAGQIFVSGTSNAAGFPSTPGAYSVSNTANQPFLVELSQTGSQTIFSATGIGGSAIAIDSSGNIYVAGTTSSVAYPTTPGAYQTSFPVFTICPGPGCLFGFQGPNQYVSKIDPTGSKLIYSTAVSGPGGSMNNGLAADAAGNVYLTGVAASGYPFTIPAPSPTYDVLNPFATPAVPFLSKLDPMGQTLLFSVPVGGGGVQVDSAGNVYVGGSVGSALPPNNYGADYEILESLPALAGVPAQCLPNLLTIADSAYVAQVDASSGNLLATQFLGGSTLAASAVALSGPTLWVAGTTNDPNVLYTPNALTLPDVAASLTAGTYLGAVDFSQPAPPAGAPQVACVLDAGDLAPVGPASRYQLLAIFGTNLGPATGVSASDNSTTTLAGVQVNFGSTPALLLYASSAQINLAVPLVEYSQQFSPLQVISAAGTSTALATPLTFANPSLFLNDTESLPVTSTARFFAAALNADGTVNSPGNPAPLGSVIGLFVNGATADPDITTAPVQFFVDGWTVTNQQMATPFVWQVELQTPSVLQNNFSCPPSQAPVCSTWFSLYYGYGGLSLAPVNTGRQNPAVVYVRK